ncbi:hypothetical protein EJB05_36984 [Eragrostis curvula]|uniref:F-box domain-containing protein n=1 Tax=Eragrostis curvula TaxID=38414 RepID=A0A5J9TZL5_9POAL|nr:hypothetical protein EJB05_36984 [Eragrostis curvula]
MGAAASVANGVTRSSGARHLLGEMLPLKKCKHDTGAAAGDSEGIDVLAHILGFLPAEEAVRTCVLARRWRHLWKSATALHVVAADGKFLGTVEKLVEFGDLFLTLREGASFDMCEIMVGYFSVPDGNWHVDEDVLRRLSIWFRHAVMCRVRFLKFHILCNNNDCFISPCHEFEDLPLVSQHLKRLELFGVQLGTSLLDFSSCPALEHLVFKWCDISMPAEKISLEFPRSLKYLTMDSSYFGDLRVHIYAPSLVSLHFDDFRGRTPVLGSMPSLVEAFVQITGPCFDICGLWWGNHCDCEHCESSDNNSVLLKGLSEARDLTLISDPAMFIFRMDMRCCPTFSKLKTLLLNDYWCVLDDFCALSCILEHSPVLEKLTLQLFSQWPPHKVQLKGSINPRLRHASISEHLETVEIKCKVIDERVLKVFQRYKKFWAVVDQPPLPVKNCKGKVSRLEK